MDKSEEYQLVLCTLRFIPSFSNCQHLSLESSLIACKDLKSVLYRIQGEDTIDNVKTENIVTVSCLCKSCHTNCKGHESLNG